ncbi:RND family efflux transporter, MFP subunit [Bartonella apihabitans]|uniref:RND family efflux transporter, MFP subunit n=1 Tax=Bartonella apihabitans TaxID=2750929 RepID=A0A1U9MDN5_9HYPH|nr:HlyD family secretion protein [Bartonella apihabitans]AQT43404.1 RND family efflux transporter, MFP subunit [Bartonella apihabitans]
MNKLIANSGRIFFTLVMALVAGLLLWQLWNYYMNDPWTRDGKISADVVRVAPDVSGFVTEVHVVDNQLVKQGDVLFTIDQARFSLALEDAQAMVDNAKAAHDQAKRDLERDQKLDDKTITRQQLETAAMQELQTAATLRKAIVQLDTAKLDLERSTVRAAVNGKLTNFSLQPGEYVTQGKPVTALVDTDSFYASGYFEENKLDRIRIGSRATIHIMGSNTVLTGVVEGFAAGIEDRERTQTTSLLANVAPTFNWVRLAQRIPVRIKLDPVPDSVHLVSGRTISVAIEEKKQ